jgi:hypothetical protein
MEEEKVPVFKTWNKAYLVVMGVELCVIILLYLLTVRYK